MEATSPIKQAAIKELEEHNFVTPKDFAPLFTQAQISAIAAAIEKAIEAYTKQK